MSNELAGSPGVAQGAIVGWMQAILDVERVDHFAHPGLVVNCQSVIAHMCIDVVGLAARWR
jgi:hypothetical protein